MEGLVDGNNLLLSSDLNPDATAVEKAHTHFSASVYATTFLNFVLRKKGTPFARYSIVFYWLVMRNCHATTKTAHL